MLAFYIGQLIFESLDARTKLILAQENFPVLLVAFYHQPIVLVSLKKITFDFLYDTRNMVIQSLEAIIHTRVGRHVNHLIA